MFAGESDFGCLWVVVGAVRGLSLLVGVLGHGAPPSESENCPKQD